jgi:hypothetical protein
MTGLNPTLRTAPFAAGALVLFNQERAGRDPGSFLVITTLKSGAQFASLGLQFAMNRTSRGLSC